MDSSNTINIDIIGLQRVRSNSYPVDLEALITMLLPPEYFAQRNYSESYLHVYELSFTH